MIFSGLAYDLEEHTRRRDSDDSSIYTLSGGRITLCRVYLLERWHCPW